MTSDDRQLDLDSFDPERFRGLLDLAIESHPERERVDRFLAAGAEFVAYNIGNNNIRITLEFTSRDPAVLAALRAGTQTGRPPTTTDYDPKSDGFRLIMVEGPLAVVERINRG